MCSDPFDEKAATWDDDPAKVERAAVVARRIVAAVPLDATMRLLEYGAGTGLVTQALRREAGLTGPAVLADTSAGMREAMEAKVAAGALGDAEVSALDLGDGAPPGERFDLAVTVMVLHHIPELEPVLTAFAELLRPGGHLCIVDLEHEDGSFHGEGFGGHHGFRRQDLGAQLTAAGFAEVTFTHCHDLVRDGVTYPLFLATCRR